jgi:hypothetical protein
MVIVLVSSVTAAASDITLPHPMVAPVLRTLAACEIIVPWNEVVVPRVAALPTAQVMVPVYGPELPALNT